nr:hypothetical protein [Tanacetum cinerariifolium]
RSAAIRNTPGAECIYIGCAVEVAHILKIARLATALARNGPLLDDAKRIGIGAVEEGGRRVHSSFLWYW